MKREKESRWDVNVAHGATWFRKEKIGKLKLFGRELDERFRLLYETFVVRE